MGKYMRKAKLTGEIALMEVSHHSSLGVRTRAKTLALKRLQKNPASLTPAASPIPEPDASSYLQLRNRRLEKPLAAASRPKDALKSKSPNATAAICSANSGHVGLASAASCCSKKDEREEEAALETSPESEGVEASFGENVLEFEALDRNVRETTPCSLIRDSEVAVTPGSTSRTRTTSNRRTQSTTRRDIPTSEEMEEFFAGAEQRQQRIFTEKYNFDPVKDCPLLGRYEWVRLDS